MQRRGLLKVFSGFLLSLGFAKRGEAKTDEPKIETKQVFAPADVITIFDQRFGGAVNIQKIASNSVMFVKVHAQLSQREVENVEAKIRKKLFGTSLQHVRIFVTTDAADIEFAEWKR